MKKKVSSAIKIVFVLLLLSFFVPMPHGGTFGGNIAKSIGQEITKFFSPEAKAVRKKEEDKLLFQKEKIKKSWGEFEQENPQYFPKK